jgi:hypothetical protein
MTTTKSRATRAAEKAQQDSPPNGEAGREPLGAASMRANEPQPELPTAAFDLGAGRIVYYRPSLTLPDGVTVDCPHEQWGHGSEKTALACIRKAAAEHGVKLA